MTGNAINAKSEALELHEMSSEELDAVSGGDIKNQDALNQQHIDEENKQAAAAFMTFHELIQQM
jgi:hypothetical protein